MLRKRAGKHHISGWKFMRKTKRMSAALFCLCLVLAASGCERAHTSLEDKALDLPDVFQEVLKQYRQIPAGTNLYSDMYSEKVTQGDWKDVYEYLGGAENICFSLYDLTKDGFPELIMGSYAKADAVPDEYEKVFQVQGSDWENSYV